MQGLCLLALLMVGRVGVCAPLESDHRYTFGELFRIGMDHSNHVASADIDVENLNWDRLQALGTFLPKVNLGAGVNRSEQEIKDYLGNDGQVVTLPTPLKSEQASNSWTLNASQDIFKGFSTWSDYKQAALSREGILAAKSQAMLQLRHDLLQMSHAIIARRELLKRDQELLKQVEEQHRFASARFEVGAVTELDVLQTEIDLGNQQILLENSRQDLRAAWDDLAVLVGLEPGAQAELDLEFSAFEPEWSAEELNQQAHEHRYEITSQQRRLEISRWATKSSRAAFLPTISLDFQYSRRMNRSTLGDLDLIPDNNSTWLGLNFNLPLFNGFASTNGWQHSRAEERRQQLNLDQERRLTRASIEDGLRRLRSSWEQSRVTAKNRELARRSLEMEQERYAQGLATLLNVQVARATWRRAETGHIQQQLDFRDRLASLELTIGIELQNP